MHIGIKICLPHTEWNPCCVFVHILQEVRRDAKKNAKATYKPNGIAAKWLSLVNNMKVKMTQLKDELAAESNAIFSAELNYQGQLAVEKELQLSLAKLQEIR